ncbi:hypothetical protein MACK_003905 [Theileria orientalis]|uniref:Uncharacterized protein n=1 Tax=Theileria orientalis TaxID=68886 RepID=A0A976SJ48_THEOR|nr:hypothetical protein MACK_003905 [Theileria orientalis]
MVCIYLGRKSGKYETYVSRAFDATINVKSELYDKCKNFEVVKYNIKYPDPYNFMLVQYMWNMSSYYNVYIYTGSGDHERGSYPFAYYSPSENEDVIKEVKVFYSVLNPSTPLGIIFITRKKSYNMYYYSYNELVKLGSKYYHIGGKVVTDGGDLGYVVDGGQLSVKLKQEYTTLSKSKQITLTVGKGQCKDIRHVEYDVGDDNKFKKRIYTPDFKKGEQNLLPSEDLFKKGIGDYTLNDSYLSKVCVKKSDGIIVYYSVGDKVTLLVEFICDSSKTHIKRLNKDGTCWKEESIEYKNDNILIKRLSEIQSRLGSEKECKQLEVRNSNNGDGSGRRDEESGGHTESNIIQNGKISQTSTQEVPSLHGVENTRETEELTTQSGGHETPTTDQETPGNSNTDWAAISGGTVGAVGLGGTGLAIYRFNNTILTFIKGLF